MTPLKIGICGAPGSGKSKLALRLKCRDLWGDDAPFIIDDYVPALTQSTGLAFAEWANYIQNLQVAMERYTKEKMIWSDPTAQSITVGTIFDTMLYAALYADLSMTYDPREKIAVQRRAEVSMATYGMILNDTFAYDYCFWCAYRPDTVSDNHFYNELDKQYPMLFDSFISPVVHLTEPDEESNLLIAEGVIREVEKKRESTKEATQSPEADESGVRESRDPGEKVGDTTGSMPNLPNEEN